MRTLIAAAVIFTFLLPYTPRSQAQTYPTGDVNFDCRTNVIDLLLVAKRFGAFRGSLLYSPVYDLSGNGRIDVADLQIVAVNDGAEC